MTFKNEHGDYSVNNLIILCYNCCFLTSGAPSVVNRVHIEHSFKHPEKYNQDRDQWKDPSNTSSGLGLEPEDDLTEEEIRKIKEEIDRELGRS